MGWGVFRGGGGGWGGVQGDLGPHLSTSRRLWLRSWCLSGWGGQPTSLPLDVCVWAWGGGIISSGDGGGMGVVGHPVGAQCTTVEQPQRSGAGHPGPVGKGVYVA